MRVDWEMSVWGGDEVPTAGDHANFAGHGKLPLPRAQVL
jgi:hypothetical protein